MSEHNRLTPQSDEYLIQVIDRVVTTSPDDRPNDNSIESFCTLLAQATPMLDEAAQQQLKTRLVSQYKQTVYNHALTQGETRPTTHSSKKPLNRVGGNLTQAALSSPRSWNFWKPLIIWGSLGIFLIGLLLGFVPEVRAMVMQTLAQLRQSVVGISASGPTEPLIFTPTPNFVVKQPNYLPAGFNRAAERYHPGADAQSEEFAPTIIGQTVQLPDEAAETTAISPAVQQAVERDRGSEPHLVIAYQDGSGHHFALFQRAAEPDETLPPGEQRTVDDQVASLQKTEQLLKLTWIDEGTWIELESSLPEVEVMTIAESLEPTPQTTSPVADPPFCDPSQQPPTGFLLGEVPDQAFKGSVVVNLMILEEYPFPETVSYSSSVSDVRQEVFLPALMALQDQATILQPLDYPSLIQFTGSDTENCLKPDPSVAGYIVIEVWSNQINLGYGGKGAELKDRAIKALEQELEAHR